MSPKTNARTCHGKAAVYSSLTGYLTYFLRCESALAAAVFDAAEVRPSRKTCDAAVAARAEVRSLLV